MFKIIRFSLLLLLSAALPLKAYADITITRLADKQIVSMQQLTAQTEAADLVLIGEVHDNPAIHDLQLSVIHYLNAKKHPLAIGLEVMQADSQQQLDDWTNGKLSEEDFRVVFARNWSYDWRLYRDIFIFARENRIPMIGLNVPKELAKKVSRQGCKTLTAEEKRRLPQGANCDLNNPHTEFLKQSFQGLFSASGRNFNHFCEAQTLRNSGMAATIAQYAKMNPKRKIVVLAGIWHAVKNAVPEQMARNGSTMTGMVIMPEIPELSGGRASAEVVDYLVQIPAP